MGDRVGALLFFSFSFLLLLLLLLLLFLPFFESPRLGLPLLALVRESVGLGSIDWFGSEGVGQGVEVPAADADDDVKLPQGRQGGVHRQHAARPKPPGQLFGAVDGAPDVDLSRMVLKRLACEQWRRATYATRQLAWRRQTPRPCADCAQTRAHPSAHARRDEPRSLAACVMNMYSSSMRACDAGTCTRWHSSNRTGKTQHIW